MKQLKVRVDEELYKAVKLKCVEKGVTIQSLVETSLRAWTGVEAESKSSTKSVKEEPKVESKKKSEPVKKQVEEPVENHAWLAENKLEDESKGEPKVVYGNGRDVWAESMDKQ